ncbi:MAG: serine/threonine protein phosphatase [Ruminococcaceae bacterium]|nr:serine/threonine protein phosphatase [Oscillospiraceae bacterium]
MALYTISDLHLSKSVDKPMDVFGPLWEDYENRLLAGFEKLSEDDITVIQGDISWAMSMSDSLLDFKFIDSLPGKKIISKGNHDYWWDTATKIKRFFSENEITTIDILHNNAFSVGNFAICGTRGWFYEEENGNSRKIYDREIGRLKRSLEEGIKTGADRILCFLHYPPICSGYECDEITDMLRDFGVERCFYGHLHGYGHKSAFEGVHKNVDYSLVSADYLAFDPYFIG